MYRLRIDEITLKSGHKIEPTNVTIFIGPNNVGKSAFLRIWLPLRPLITHSA